MEPTDLEFSQEQIEDQQEHQNKMRNLRSRRRAGDDEARSGEEEKMAFFLRQMNPWTCPTCTFEEDKFASVCSVCEENRPYRDFQKEQKRLERLWQGRKNRSPLYKFRSYYKNRRRYRSPRRQYRNNDPECTICKEPANEDDGPLNALCDNELPPRNHHMHTGCLNRWLAQPQMRWIQRDDEWINVNVGHNSCPGCRKPCKPQDVIEGMGLTWVEESDNENDINVWESDSDDDDDIWESDSDGGFGRESKFSDEQNRENAKLLMERNERLIDWMENSPINSQTITAFEENERKEDRPDISQFDMHALSILTSVPSSSRLTTLNEEEEGLLINKILLLKDASNEAEDRGEENKSRSIRMVETHYLNSLGRDW